MKNLIVSHATENVDEGYLYCDTERYESYAETWGEAFRAAREEFGRCVGKIYRDRNICPGRTSAEFVFGNCPPVIKTDIVGWIFEKRMKYSDTNETYLARTWFEVHKEVTA